MQDEVDENAELLKKQKGFGSDFSGRITIIGQVQGHQTFCRNATFGRDCGMCYRYYHRGGV